MRWTCLFLLLICPALGRTADGVDAGSASPASTDPTLAAIDALWTQRGDPAKAEEGIRQSAAALDAHPNDVELMFRLARAKLWVGDGLENNDDRKQKLGREVWDLGDRIVKAKPAWVGGHYYAAAGIGIYSQAVGILKALGEGLESKFNERLDKAIEIDPKFQKEMPLIAKGRYYFELPWPKRNLGKSAAWYRKALALDPNNMRAMAWLGETLWRDGDVAGARAQLARVQETHLPDDPAEEARVKSIAQKIAAQMDKEGAK
ncbi:MAG TPA: tetratricopeptide repeat protein [Myxococcaceae bacterium]|nr:tetratricopeptide repeat protein [Myxococcaceae bacterium]